MFELFTEPARRVIYFARSEAAQCGSAFIETEHLLAGVLGQDRPLALQLFGSEEAVTALRAKASSPEVATKASTSADLPLTRQSSRVLAYAAEEGQRLAHRYIGTEHLLLGLMREENSRAAQALRESGLDLPSLRERFAQQKSHDPEVRRREQLHHLVDDLPPELWDSAEEALRGIRRGVAMRGPETTRPGLPGVLARYTEKARRTIFFSRFEASQFGAKSIESEHLLLGLMREYSHLRDVLVEAGTSPRGIRKEIEQRKPPAAEKVPTSIDLPLSHDSKRAMAFATEEADRLNHKHIGNEHLLAGLLREENCLAAELLQAHGITLEAARTDLEKGDSSA